MSKKQQVQINRMIEALEMIAAMPVYQAGVSLGGLCRQYDEARETARLAVAQFNRSEAEGEPAFDAEAVLEATRGMAHDGGAVALPGMDIQRMVALTEPEYLKLLRESGRGRQLACYILGRTEDLKTISDYRDALVSVRGKCDEEVAHG